MRSVLEKLLDGQVLSEAELSAVFEAMFQGSLEPCQMAAFLAGWRVHGETSRELTAGARCMRAHAQRPTLPPGLGALTDNCGTGGDGSGSFNISTTAAVVAAACGVKLAKHGNRSVSSRCGSADLFFALGFPAALRDDQAVDLLAATGLSFFFAPQFHPGMRPLMPLRQSLGVRTIFNLLGPLANPLTPAYQLLGVGHRRYLTPMAETLAALGIRKAAVVHSDDGLDELSPAAPSQLIVVDGQHLTPMRVEPRDYGIVGSLTDLQGGDAATNALIFQRILGGEASGAAEAVILNAGAVLWVAAQVADLHAGVALARSRIADGHVQAFFNSWLQTAQHLSVAP